MSRPQDQFIDDDEEETCPLCVEEFDLTDKGFRPCPCGYQICQFCYHNVKTNMNGLCPACRRQYNDDDIEYKAITPEETAAYKARQAQKQKKTQAALQKEKQKAEADNLSRKHLAGLRVVQKNLVYVTGLQPTLHEDQLLQTLRGPDYFGQYGKIIKIVVSKAKDPTHPHAVGVYVTYERKEDAEACIAAVDGTRNLDKQLRAQFGTTKYCSAYLRGENCTNRNCMFLHEPGEGESYSRADLSALNAGSSQRSLGRTAPPPAQHAVASASQPMARQQSSDRAESPSADRPALPSTASWASKMPQVQPSRTESRSTSGTVESPTLTNAIPAKPEPPSEQPAPIQQEVSSQPQVEPTQPPQRPRRPREASPLLSFLKNFSVDDFKFSFSIASLPEADQEIIKNYPPLFDLNGGAKRRLRRQREEEQRRMEQEAQAFQQPPSVEHDDNLELTGSLSLGGEPEERQSMSQPQSAIQPPGPDGMLDQRFQFGGMSSPGINDRSLTPQQRQQLQQSMKSPGGQGSFLNMNQPTSYQQSSHPPGHQRNASRYSFANESSASTSVKPVANAKLMSQQSSMMPQGVPFGSQQHANPGQFYTSNVQGPPPGLKATGTPPVSGGMTFGQGHGFATGGLQYGANAGGRNANEEMMRSLLRGREAGAGSADAAKHDTEFPPLATPSRQQSVSLDDSRRSTPPVPPGFEAQAANESRRSTPTVPPGLSKPSAIPDLEGGSGSRPSSRASLKRTTSQITPALPLRPSTPAQTAEKVEGKGESQREMETPTKASKGTVGQTEAAKAAGGTDASQPTTVEPAAAEVQTSGKAPEDTAPKADPSAPVSKKETDKANKRATAVPEKAAPKQPMQPASKGQATVQATDAKAAPVSHTKPESSKPDAQKRKHPGKLDIAAAVSKDEVTASSSIAAAEPDSSEKSQRSASQAQAEATKSDASNGNVASPVARAAPKTLRVLPTPKAETPPSATVTTSKEPIPSTTKGPSRQPSVASINLPGTPSSEQVSISDNISVTSTSQSRANSPPPAGSNKVGSAPARAKTKNQQKKERQERAKAIEDEKAKTEEGTKAVNDEPAQEAIVSRKKKTKKEKDPKPKPKAAAPAPTTEESTPTASRPASPQQKPATEASPKPEQPAKEQKASKPSTPTSTSATQAPPTQSPHEPSPPPTPTLSASQLLAELKATAPEIQKCIDSLLRTPTSNHYKPTQNISQKDFRLPQFWEPALSPRIPPPLLEKMLDGTAPAYRYTDQGPEDQSFWTRGMITPKGAHIRALTEELELRFLELEKAINDLPQELRFRPSKPQNEMKFPSIDLELRKRQLDNARAGGRAPNVMEQTVLDGSAIKKGAFLVDGPERYVDEFVRPPATPPPSAGGSGSARGQTGGAGGAMSGVTEPPVMPSVDIAERQLNEARRVAEERDVALKKVIKKNKKILGLG